MTLNLNPLIAAGVVASTSRDRRGVRNVQRGSNGEASIASSVVERAVVHAVGVAVISYTGNSIYVIFAATGSWIGAYFSVRWLSRSDSKTTLAAPAPWEILRCDTQACRGNSISKVILGTGTPHSTRQVVQDPEMRGSRIVSKCPCPTKSV